MSEMVLNELVHRTNGDVYIGVVGPVRVGKSTLVKKMMENIVLPNMHDPYLRETTIDEMPQSSPGPVIMTAEPKFVPANAIPVQVEGVDVPFRIRFADCVGYIVDGAQGYEHDGKEKLVHTPWNPEPIPFKEAARIGTDKVMKDHATIGIVVTTDGSINGFTRESVEVAERQILEQLKEIQKPIVIVLNSVHPYIPQTIQLKNDLMERYQVPVISCSIDRITPSEMNEIVREALLEFPVQHIHVEKPDWLEVLDENDAIHIGIQDVYDRLVDGNYKMRNMKEVADAFYELPFVEQSELIEVNSSNGEAKIQLQLTEESFIESCEALGGQTFDTKKNWLLFLKEAAIAKRNQKRFMAAIQDAEDHGYGIALPSMEHFIPNEPELIQQNNFYGVKLTTTAPSYHIIRVDLQAEFAPLIGSEFHSRQLLKELQAGYEKDHRALWNISLFGTSLSEVLSESLRYKMNELPESAKKKMRSTVEQMVNDGEKGLITFVL